MTFPFEYTVVRHALLPIKVCDVLLYGCSATELRWSREHCVCCRWLGALCPIHVCSPLQAFNAAHEELVKPRLKEKVRVCGVALLLLYLT